MKKNFVYILFLSIFLISCNKEISNKEFVVKKQAKEEKVVVLELGEKAPNIPLVAWVGKQWKTPAQLINFNQFKDKVVMLEIWASWCSYCEKALPELARMQNEQGKDLVIISLSPEAAEQVVPYVKKQRSLGMKNYYVGMIDRESEMFKKYGMGDHGIPYSFLIDKKGHLAWQGYAEGKGTLLGGYEANVKKLLAENYNLKSAISISAQGKAIKTEIEQLKSTLKLVRKSEPRHIYYQKSAESYARVEQLATKLIDIDPFNLSYHEIKIESQKKRIIYLNQFDRSAIEALLKNLSHSWLNLEKVAIRAEVNALDWANDLMGESNLAFRFPKVALRLAQGALKLSNGKKSENYSAVAKAYFQLGNTKKAVSFQKRALSLVTEKESQWKLKKVLAYYRRALKFI